MWDRVRSTWILVSAMSIVAGADAAAADAAIEASGAFEPLPKCSSISESHIARSSAGLIPPGAEPNALSEQERRGRWRLLFDGRTLENWTGFERSTLPSGWLMKDGVLLLTRFSGEMPSSERGDIRTVDTFGNFELRLQWAIAPGGNSGIFFHAREGVEDRIWKSAPEMQILDDARHEDGAMPSHRSGGLYDVYPPECDATKPVGEYNDVRLIVREGHVEHWLNGYRVAEYELGSAEFKVRVSESKFRDTETFAAARRGYLALQDHGDEIRFRGIRIREL